MKRRSLLSAGLGLLGYPGSTFATSHIQVAATSNQTFLDHEDAAGASIELEIHQILLSGFNDARDQRGGVWTDDPLRGDGDTFVTAEPNARTWHRLNTDDSDPLPDSVKRSIATPRKSKFLMLSDMQPSTLGEIKEWRRRFSQIREKHRDADFVLLLGDLVNRGEPYRDPIARGDEATEDQYLFNQLLDDVAGFPTDKAKLIALPGNHDRSYLDQKESASGRRFDEYLKHFERQFFHLKFGNIVLICVGNVTHHTEQAIPEFLFEWLKSIVEANQDCIIILATHEPLPDVTNKTASGKYKPLIYPAQRFISMLQSETSRVDILPSGHVGGDYRRGREIGWSEKYGSFHLQVTGNLGVSVGPSSSASYVVMELTHGLEVARFSRFDADTGDEIDQYDYKLRHQASLSNDFTYDGRYQVDPRHDVQMFPAKRYVNVPRTATPAGWRPSEGVTWIQTYGMLDVSADDMPAGTGVGIRFDLPGAQTNDLSSTVAYSGYGFGGGLSFHRLSDSENDYSARFAVSVNDGKGSIEENIKQTISSTATGSVVTVWSSRGVPNNVHFLLGSVQVDGGDNSILPETSARFAAGRVTSGTAALSSRTDSERDRTHLVFENPNGAVGSIVTNGSSTSYLTSSDRRLKRNFGPISNALRRVNTLAVYSGEFTSQPGVEVDYFIADEVMAVVPHAVSGKPDDTEEIGNHYQLADKGDLYDEASGAVIAISVWFDDPRRIAGFVWRKTAQEYRLKRSGVTREGITSPDRWKRTGQRPLFQGIDQAKLLPVLWAAVQQLSEENDMLKARLKSLEAQIYRR